MVKKSTKSKKVKTQHKTHIGRPIIFGVILFVVILILACTALVSIKKNTYNNSYVAFSLAMTEPDNSDVKAIVKFLKHESKNSGCDNGGRGYFSVRSYTEDLTQLYLGYGCTSTESPMYAVKTDSGWKTISPTSQFDVHGNPSCEMVDANQIQQSIAPVCWTADANGANPSYIVR